MEFITVVGPLSLIQALLVMPNIQLNKAESAALRNAVQQAPNGVLRHSSCPLIAGIQSLINGLCYITKASVLSLSTVDFFVSRYGSKSKLQDF
jgi:hypothetical protein